MFGLIKKRDLAAFAERVHNDNALDARICAPMQPVSYEEHKRAAYYSGYVDGSRALLFALRAYLFGGKRKRKVRPITKDVLGRQATISPANAKTYREFETIVTLRIHEISKNVVAPEPFDIGAYKLGVEDRIRRVLREADLYGDNVNVKVQVVIKKDEGE